MNEHPKCVYTPSDHPFHKERSDLGLSPCDPPGQPYGWIQWKGTQVCADLHCACGLHGHIDADFAYYVECPRCHRIYSMCANVMLHELSEEAKAFVLSGETCAPRPMDTDDPSDWDLDDEDVIDATAEVIDADARP